MPERVAVIGGGVTGLMATKILTEDGYHVDSYETRPYLGGLWRDTPDSSISVQPATIFNSSKYRIAISDFPFPESTNDYPTALQLYNYLNSYADKFDLRQHYHLNTKVQHILRKDDRWCLKLIDTTNDTPREVSYDRVCVATGTFSIPRFPKIHGLENFRGQVLHSIDFHDPESFRDKNVLVIGMHATAQDITDVLSTHAKHVYLSHRSGVLCLPRYLEDGTTFDTMGRLPTIFIQLFLETWLPSLWIWLLNLICAKASRKAFGQLSKDLGLEPHPNMAVATPIMADVIYPFLKSGFAEPVSAIKTITGPKTVELTDGKVLNDIDAIIYCTGYHISIPDNLIPKNIPSQPTSDARTSNHPDSSSYNPYPHGPGTIPHLYMNTFPMSPSPTINTTLAFLGQAAITFPGFLQNELQICAISQIWQGRKPLPSPSEMIAWHSRHTARRAALAARYAATENGTFYTCSLPFAEYFPWLNYTAGTGVLEHFGGKFNGLFNWRAWRLWWADREMWNLCTKGILSPTIFRVFEMGGRKRLDWEEARRSLRWENEVFERAKVGKKEELEREKEKKEKTGLTGNVY